MRAAIRWIHANIAGLLCCSPERTARAPDSLIDSECLLASTVATLQCLEAPQCPARPCFFSRSSWAPFSSLAEAVKVTARLRRPSAPSRRTIPRSAGSSSGRTASTARCTACSPRRRASPSTSKVSSSATRPSRTRRGSPRSSTPSPSPPPPHPTRSLSRLSSTRRSSGNVPQDNTLPLVEEQVDILAATAESRSGDTQRVAGGVESLAVLQGAGRPLARALLPSRPAPRDGPSTATPARSPSVRIYRSSGSSRT